MEGKLNEAGIYTYRQIASWTNAQMEAFGERRHGGAPGIFLLGLVGGRRLLGFGYLLGLLGLLLTLGVRIDLLDLGLLLGRRRLNEVDIALWERNFDALGAKCRVDGKVQVADDAQPRIDLANENA